MNPAFDLVQALFWGGTYFSIILFGFIFFQKKIKSIPLTAVILNFSWELNAVIESRGYWVHALWLSLDAVVLFLTLWSFDKRWLMMRIAIALLVVFSVALHFIFGVENGQLISVFVIDCLMAASFFAFYSQIDIRGKVIVAIFKLMGDLFAFLAYKNTLLFVEVAGWIVLVFNSVYLIFCLADTIKALRNTKRFCKKIVR